MPKSHLEHHFESDDFRSVILLFTRLLAKARFYIQILIHLSLVLVTPFCSLAGKVERFTGPYASAVVLGRREVEI